MGSPLIQCQASYTTKTMSTLANNAKQYNSDKRVRCAYFYSIRCLLLTFLSPIASRFFSHSCYLCAEQSRYLSRLLNIQLCV